MFLEKVKTENSIQVFNMNSRLQRRVFSSNIFKPLIKPIIKVEVKMI